MYYVCTGKISIDYQFHKEKCLTHTTLVVNMYHCNIQQFILAISEPYSHSILTTDPSADNYRLSTISALTTDTAHLSRTSSTIDNSSTSLAQVSDITDDTKPDINCSNRSSILSVTDVIKTQQPLFSEIQSGIPQS